MRITDQLWMERVLADDLARLQQYKRAWEVYRLGRFKDSLKVRPGKPNDNVKVNLVRIVVNKSVAFLFGREPRFEISEVEETRAEEWLEQVWRHNRKMQFLLKVGLNGALFGHVFIKIVPQQQHPKLINLSPEYVHVITNPDDIDEVIRYIIQYPAVGPQGERLTVRQVIERDDGGRWLVTDQVSEGDGPFVTRSEAVWPYQWPPVVDCQNLPSPNEYYGIPDVDEDLINLNESINFVLSNTNRIIRHHAHPKTWGKGFTAKQLSIAVDETIVLPSPDAELHNLEMQSDLSSSIEFYRRLKEAFHEISATPEVALGKLDKVGPISGVALKILYGPLIDKTEQKRVTYGEMLIELNRRLLEMGGFGPDNITAIHWPELLPKDTMAERQVSLIDMQLGVSQDTILQRLGFDPELERAKREASSAQMADEMLSAFDRGE